jgi:hypothetical protein
MLNCFLSFNTLINYHDFSKSTVLFLFSLVMKMETAVLSDSSVTMDKGKRRHIPDYINIYSHRGDKFKSCNMNFVSRTKHALFLRFKHFCSRS